MKLIQRFRSGYQSKFNNKDRFILENKYLIEFEKNSLSITGIAIIKHGEIESLSLGSPRIINCFGYKDVIDQLQNNNFPNSMIKSDGILGSVHLNHGYDVAASGLFYRKIKHVAIKMDINAQYLLIDLTLDTTDVYHEDVIYESGKQEQYKFEFGVNLSDLPDFLNPDEEYRDILENTLSKTNEPY